MNHCGRVRRWAIALGLLRGVAVLSGGCASQRASNGTRPPGPGAFVARVGGGLVNVHDGVVRTLLGDAAKPMLIAAPDATAGDAKPAAAQPASATMRPMALAELSTFDAAGATSADLDGDGHVSIDEVVAVARCGEGDDEVLERFERTGRTFDLSASQEQYLRARGIGDDVIARLRTLNRNAAPVPFPPTTPGNVAVRPTADAPATYDSDAAAR